MRSMFLSTTRAPKRASVVFGASILLFSSAMTSFSQAPMPPMGQPATTGQNNKQLTEQIAELRAQVAKLQAAVQQPGSASMPTAGAARLLTVRYKA